MKRFLIFLAVLILGAFIVIYFPLTTQEEEPDARIIDRIPDADIIGSTDLINLSESLSKALYFYQLPIREYIDPDFTLAQAKKYGVDAQEPVFFFGNLNNQELACLGALITVRDSTILGEGIRQFNQLSPLQDTLLFGKTVYHFPEYNLHLCYGIDWLLVYKGDQVENSLESILKAKYNSISESWKTFLEQELNTAEIHIQLKGQLLAESGIEQSYIELTNDSSQLYIQNTLIFSDSIPFRIDSSYYPNFTPESYSRTQVNLNIRFKEKLAFKPLDLGLSKLNRLIGFPKKEFLNCWTGTFVLREGGFYEGREKIVETEFDENFNPVEVVRYHNVKIPSIACYLSTNGYSQRFVDSLKERGIFNQISDSEYRLLEYGPLAFIQTDTSLMLHTALRYPKIEATNNQNILFNYEGVRYQFTIDSIGPNQINTRITLPMKKMLDSFFNQ